ncbi:hypothetical protein MMC10_004683 [Thelotrema lepadinum]|nr:hypothetical protein [Thelotrema lepadinum]
MAVTTTRKQHAIEQLSTKYALKAVGENAFLNYNQNVKNMEYHSKEAAAASRRILALDRRKKQLNAKQPRLNRYDLRESKDLLTLRQQAQDFRRARHKMAERRSIQNQREQKHKHDWKEASHNAGKQLRTNRLVHAIMPKDVRPAENNPKKALQLVANNAGKLFEPRLREAQGYSKHLDLIANQLKDIHKAHDFHASDTSGQSLNPLENYHTMLHKEYEKVHRQGSKKTTEARQHLWNNRMLHLTVKGVDPIKVPELMFKSLTKGGRRRPYQVWWDTVNKEGPP